MSSETPVMRCWNCNLNQFEAVYCRRCRRPLEKPEPVPVQCVDDPGKGSWKATQFHESMATIIGQRVRVARTKKNLSQRMLSEIVRCPRTYISKIEAGNVLPEPRQIERLCIGLGISIVDLLLTDKQRDLHDLSKDPFMVEMIQTGKKMPPFYWKKIAEHAERLSNGKHLAVSS